MDTSKYTNYALLITLYNTLYSAIYLFMLSTLFYSTQSADTHKILNCMWLLKKTQVFT